MYLSNGHYFFIQQAENQQNVLLILNYWFSDFVAEVLSYIYIIVQ